MLGMAMSELSMGARYSALETIRRGAQRRLFHLGAQRSTGFPRRCGRTLARLQTVGDRHQSPRATISDSVNTSGRSEEMASIATSTHLPALGEPQERDAIGGELQATLLELADLFLIGKQLPWSVFSRLFRPLHLFLDELVDSWRELAGTVAKRAVALGYFPDGQAQAVGTRSQHTPVARVADAPCPAWRRN